MAQVRAKFVCQSVTKRLHWTKEKGYLYEAEFSAVVGGSDENKKFFDASPNGQLKLATLALDLFKPGQEYYLDFTEAS